MSQDVRIRGISDGDWDDIAALESVVYGDAGLSEGRAALRSRAEVSPDTCFLLECGRRPAGYVIALPYPMFRFPDLTRPERERFRSANLHLHDLVIAEDFRGRGLARLLLRHLSAHAERAGFEHISLVAVEGTEPFWSAQGYDAHREIAVPSCYGRRSRYMSTPVTATGGTETHVACAP
ncbi:MULTISPECIES: GNAT family N-acetyltransferase [unclassified Nonomuraea]|uniref:GNAT family N-acetyltransferase n=1 Tax=unclassified Nonomuraea TaxID=2593643 RepID=UPI00340B4FED